MASKKVIMARSAFTTREKLNILVTEGVQRVCSPSLPWEVKKKCLTRFCHQIRDSGHAQLFRDTVVSKTVASYKNSLDRFKYRPNAISKDCQIWG